MAMFLGPKKAATAINFSQTHSEPKSVLKVNRIVNIDSNHFVYKCM